MAEVFTIDSHSRFEEGVRKAVALLRAGEVVALPTETVYGLAANALDARAVQKIFEAKVRPSFNPLIVHVASFEMIDLCASAWPAEAARLARQFWPGPLTMVLPATDRVPLTVTGGGPTVGLRWPSHPFMQAVIKACGFPLAAPSANRSNEISPSQAEHVASSLGDRIPLIIDAGACNVGIESTVVDLTVNPPAILRPGMITAAQMGLTPNAKPVATTEIFKSPGMLTKHYSPRATLWIRKWKDDADLSRMLNEAGVDLGTTHIIAHDHIPSQGAYKAVLLIPQDAEAYARALYAQLHECDLQGASLIVVEELPPEPEWEGPRDRLNRAAAK